MYIDRITSPYINMLENHKNSEIRGTGYVPETEEETDENGNLINDDYYSDEYDADGTPKELDYRPAYYCDCFRDYELYTDTKDNIRDEYSRYDVDDLDVQQKPKYKYADSVFVPFTVDTDLPKIKLVKDGTEIYEENFHRKLNPKRYFGDSYKIAEARATLDEGFSKKDIANIYYCAILKRNDMKVFHQDMMEDGINALRAGFSIDHILKEMQFATLNSAKKFETYEKGSLMFLLNNPEYKDDFIRTTAAGYQYFDNLGASVFEQLKKSGKTAQEALSIVKSCRIKAANGLSTTNKKLSKLAMKILANQEESWSVANAKVLDVTTKFYPQAQYYDIDYTRYSIVEKMVEKGLNSQDILDILK